MGQHQREPGGDAVNQREQPGLSRSVQFARWIAAAIMITYGFAKLTGSQFTVLDSEATKGPLIYEGEIVDAVRIELRPDGNDSAIVLVRD